MSDIPPVTAGADPRPRRKGERTRERILDAAEDIFAERGYDGATLRDVAAAVGIQNPSLYNHFKSKESLYAAVLDRGISPVLEILSEYVGSDATVETERLLERIMELLRQHPHLPRLVQHEALAGGQRLTPMLQKWIAPIFARSTELAKARAGSGRWDPEQVPLLVLAMFNAVVGYFTIAPLYQQVGGQDLTTRKALAAQTHLLAKMADLLFAEDRPPPTDATRSRTDG